MGANTSATYQFGPFRLEVGERRLLCDGRAVPLRTKVFDTLCVLVEHSGRLLTKHELMQSIWPDTAVEENNLNHNISTLRRALGEQATGQRYIETVPRVGYRFVADVTSAQQVSRPPSLQRRQPLPERSLRQEIRFCTASDGTRIAYSTVGNGPPLVKAANWLNHLEYEWESPGVETLDSRDLHDVTCSSATTSAGAGCRIGRCRNCPSTHGFAIWKRSWTRSALERFDLLGISQGGAVAAAYAARHPERVRHLILFGAFACGWQVPRRCRAIEASGRR